MNFSRWIGMVILAARLATVEAVAQAALETIEPGLRFGELEPPVPSGVTGHSRITILEVDPKLFDFKLLAAKELGAAPMTAQEWSQNFQLLAAINAGMFLRDGKTNAGYMRNFEHVNNGRLNSKMQAVLAFNATDDTVPPFQIIDRTCQDFEALRPHYQTLIQGIRMIGCARENVWNKRDEPWSMAVLGTTTDGLALFVFTQAPYSPHDFADVLLQLPLSIKSAIYLDGGSEASFYFSPKQGQAIEKFGTHGRGFGGLLGNSSPWSIPNVIGIQRRPQPTPAAAPPEPAPTQ